MCLDILQAGYHESFSQIFNLMHQQQLVRLQAGPESVLWTKKLLDAEPEKLTMMKEWLTRAEELTLDGNHDVWFFIYILIILQIGDVQHHMALCEYCAIKMVYFIIIFYV